MAANLLGLGLTGVHSLYSIECGSENDIIGATMNAPKYGYRDLTDPSLEETVRNHNSTTLNLLLTVADFAQKVATAHKQFSAQLHTVVSQFRQISLEVKKERPVDYHNSLHAAWDALLHETEMDAQAQTETANLLIKNVYDPLVEVAQHKKSHCQKLYNFREQFETTTDKAQELLEKCHDEYMESYLRYRSNSRDTGKNLTSYFDAHNEYVLQLWASNRMTDEYHTVALPCILEELEEIYIDTSNVLNGAIESHSLLLVTKATEQSKKFEEVLKICKIVQPKNDISYFVRAIGPEPVALPEMNLFTPPESQGGTEAILKNEIIDDRLTEIMLKAKRQELQKEAAELTSYIKQNQDVTQTLMSICQRNLANHLYSKVYETQEDLCRKRNEIRMATLQLAAIRQQIELLSPKQNGTVDPDREGQRAQKATIKGMWRKAFRSLKQSKSDKPDSKYSKIGSQRRSFLKRKDSKEAQDEAAADAFSGVAASTRPSRCSVQVSEEIDPVYSLLKCAADLPKSRHQSCQGPVTLCHTGNSPKTHRSASQGGQTNLAASATSDSLNVKSTGSSRSSSPSSGHSFSPQRRRKKLNMRMKSFSLDAPDTPRQLLSIDETAKKKSSSSTSFATYTACIGDPKETMICIRLSNSAPNSPDTSNLGRRKRGLGKRASSLDTNNDGRRDMTEGPGSHHSSPNMSPKSGRPSIPSNVYVALYNFKGREKDDLDLRAGWRVSAIDKSDHDWWKGQCNGKVGYFPASYVHRLHVGQKVLVVTHSLQLNEGDSIIKLLRDQVVIQTGSEMDGMKPIKTGTGKRTLCPSKYLMEV
ncbi:uncharacterized protein LOC135492918 isoform X3 [Lineus longissimus]|uniref:uncharacterized protein LOC135492918 isoform X3 n=1 Tax=Lineus longissimus TaxID=88925 RepID=UPI00315D4C65